MLQNDCFPLELNIIGKTLHWAVSLLQHHLSTFHLKLFFLPEVTWSQRFLCPKFRTSNMQKVLIFVSWFTVYLLSLRFSKLVGIFLLQFVCSSSFILWTGVQVGAFSGGMSLGSYFPRLAVLYFFYMLISCSTKEK